MRVPYVYTLRNLWARKLTTLLTTLGMTLVVFVFATVLMLSEGLERTLVSTGSPKNAIVIRQSAETQIQSTIGRQQAAIIASSPAIAHSPTGQRLVSKELVVLVVLHEKESGNPSNVIVRGISQAGLALRPQVRIVKGRMFRPGTHEVIVGNKIARDFAHARIGGRFHLGLSEWTVVGIFDAGNTAFSSEIWGDVDQVMQAFRRNTYSSVVFRMANPDAFKKVQKQLESDQRLTVDVKRETVFYAEQSKLMSQFLKILGVTLSIIFSIGAVIGAMITMYSAVASRTAEIGTLRAIGFPQRSILLAFLLESLSLSFIGGIVGLIMASFMQFITISTINWQTFAELAFNFTLSQAIVWQSLVFSLLMGLVGGLLPAVRAARMNIVDALRTA